MAGYFIWRDYPMKFTGLSVLLKLWSGLKCKFVIFNWNSSIVIYGISTILQYEVGFVSVYCISLLMDLYTCHMNFV